MLVPMCDLVAWTRGRGWSEWHILDQQHPTQAAHTTCGRRVPWLVGVWRVVTATPEKLDDTCRSCREITADRLARTLAC
jgi:hypothetical protein